MALTICPVWMGHLLASPVRKFIQNPDAILSPYLTPGMTAVDIGCAMGFFSLPMARLVGKNGKVICVDIQDGMLKNLQKRAAKEGINGNMEYRLCDENSFHVDQGSPYADFICVFAVAHEVPAPKRLFQEAAAALKPDGLLLFSEPAGHVSKKAFATELDMAKECGFETVDTPTIKRAHTVLLNIPSR